MRVEVADFIQLDPGHHSPGHGGELVRPVPPSVAAKLTLALKQETEVPDVPPTLIQLASQQQYKALFWDTLVPHRSGTSYSTAGALLPPSLSWLQTAFRGHSGDPALSAAVLALAIARLGRVSQNADLLQIATRLHGSTIHQVRKKLTERQTSGSDDSLLASVMLLAFYEVCVSTERVLSWRLTV